MRVHVKKLRVKNENESSEGKNEIENKIETHEFKRIWSD